MARRKSRRRDWRVILFLAISLLIVVSMILFTILPALPSY
jgi:predicted nucleic acid-binding Zn ribbon protein